MGNDRRMWRGAAVLVAIGALIGSIGIGSAASAAPGAVATLEKHLGVGQSSTVNSGSTVQYELRYQCSSLTVPCDTLAITDVMDPRLEFVSISAPSSTINFGNSFDTATNTLTITGSPFTDGDQGSIFVTAKVRPGTPAGVIPNQATITIPDAAPFTTPPVNITVQAGTPQWSMAKYVTAPAGNPQLGQTVSYRVELVSGSAVGNVSMGTATMVDTYPAGATVVGADGGTVDPVNHTITWVHTNVAPVAAGTTAISHVVQLRYDAPTFATGQVVTNSVLTAADYTDGTSGTVGPATKNVTIGDAVREVTTVKSGPASLVQGTSVVYTVQSSLGNTNDAVTGLTLTDTLPVGLNWSSVDFSMGVNMPAVVFESTTDGAAWTAFGSWTPGQWPQGGLPIPAGATAVRMRALAGALNIGYPGFVYTVKGTVATDTPAGTAITNCASSSADNATILIPQACVTRTVQAPNVIVVPEKANLSTPGVPIVPGSTFTMGLAYGRPFSDQNPGSTDFYLYDLLPAQLDYVGIDCAGVGTLSSGAAYAWSTLCTYSPGDSAGLVVTPIIQPNYQGSGRTLVKVHIVAPRPQGTGALTGVKMIVQVRPGTPAGNYSNTGGVLNTDLPQQCQDANPASTDQFDADGDGATTEKTCEISAPFSITASAAVSAEKWDTGFPGLDAVSESTGQAGPDCPVWGQYTRYPCVAQTLPNGSFGYRWKFQNQGNQNLTDYRVYDILPHVGDTGVSQVLAGQARGSRWAAQLTGPLTFEGTVPAGANPLVEYNLTYNPCRPELNSGTADGPWQTGCDDTWLTAAQVTDWSQVKSFRVTMYQAGAIWAPGDAVIAAADIKVPLDAGLSTQVPLNLSAAWNSVAHRVFAANNDSSTTRLPPSEPRKVGVIIPFDGVPVVTIKKFSTAEGLPDGDHNLLPGKQLVAGTPEALTFTITNPGTEPLTNVAVTDSATSGPELTGLSCDFSTLGGPATGTTWAGPFNPADTFNCTGTLPGLASDQSSADVAHVSGTGSVTGLTVEDQDSWNGWTPATTPSIRLEKFSTLDGFPAGDYDTSGGKQLDPNAPEPITFVLYNNGSEPLTNFDVSDITNVGPALVNLDCDWTPVIGPVTGTRWNGTLPVGMSIICQGVQPALSPGEVAQDVGNVTANGVESGTAVTATDPWSGFAADVPQLTVAKWSTADGPDAGDFDLPPGKSLAPNTDTPVTFTITNTGSEAVQNLTLSDLTPDGPRLTGVSCLAPGETAPIELTGTPAMATWAGPLAVGAVITCTGTLPGLAPGVTHSDVVTAGGTGVISGLPVSGNDPFNAFSPATAPTIGLEKWLTGEGFPLGDHDTSPGASVAPNASQSVSFVVSNLGNEPLASIDLADATVSGPAVTGLSCDFSPLGGPASGLSWAGPLAVGASFMCSATLPGLDPGALHHDNATVTAVGAASGTAVTANDPLYVTAQTPTPPPTLPVFTPPSNGLSGTGFDALSLASAGLLIVAAGVFLRRRVS